MCVCYADLLSFFLALSFLLRTWNAKIHTNDYIMAIKTDEIAEKSEGLKIPKV